MKKLLSLLAVTLACVSLTYSQKTEPSIYVPQGTPLENETWRRGVKLKEWEMMIFSKEGQFAYSKGRMDNPVPYSRNKDKSYSETGHGRYYYQKETDEIFVYVIESQRSVRFKIEPDAPKRDYKLYFKITKVTEKIVEMLISQSLWGVDSTGVAHLKAPQATFVKKTYTRD